MVNQEARTGNSNGRKLLILTGCAFLVKGLPCFEEISSCGSMFWHKTCPVPLGFCGDERGILQHKKQSMYVTCFSRPPLHLMFSLWNLGLVKESEHFPGSLPLKVPVLLFKICSSKLGRQGQRTWKKSSAMHYLKKKKKTKNNELHVSIVFF